MSIFIIGEAGSNHDGSLTQAMRLVNVAAEAGCDAVKFQLFSADRLYPRGTREWEIVKPLELPIAWLPDLAARCESLGVEFMCSAFDPQSVDAVDPYLRRHKVASLEAHDRSLIRHMADKGKPLIVSSGTLTTAELRDLVADLPAGSQVLHCTTAYPCPPEQANVGVVRGLAGLSDHTADPVVAPVMAVALGAQIIEKHFTIDRSLLGPDHWYALEPAELREMVRCVRLAEKMRGDGVKRTQPSEERYLPLRHRDGGLRGG